MTVSEEKREIWWLKRELSETEQGLRDIGVSEKRRLLQVQEHEDFQHEHQNKFEMSESFPLQQLES